MQVIANLAATTSRRARLGGEQTSRQRAGPDDHNLNLAQDAQGGKMTLKELNPDGRKTSSTCHRVWRALRLIHGVRDIFHFVAERGTFQKFRRTLDRPFLTDHAGTHTAYALQRPYVTG
ncbi:MAG: hypothetical protein JOY95_08770 [Silvibacterium sp.]|nr:hypothetical protein [Silvibacterium sp.]